MEKIDLFEQHKNLPRGVERILEKYSEMDETYENCEKLVEELEEVGYTCEYGLDGSPFGLRKIIKKGNSYTYEDIESLTIGDELNDANFSLEDLGGFRVGKNFLVLEHNTKDQIASFVLTGTQGDSTIWECVYTDFE